MENRKEKRKENGKEREREREREGGIRADRGADRDCTRTRVGQVWRSGRWFVTRGTGKKRGPQQGLDIEMFGTGKAPEILGLGL